MNRRAFLQRLAAVGLVAAASRLPDLSGLEPRRRYWRGWRSDGEFIVRTFDTYRVASEMGVWMQPDGPGFRLVLPDDEVLVDASWTLLDRIVFPKPAHFIAGDKLVFKRT
jgi:hypothetical protein